MQALQLDVGDMIQIKTASLELARQVKLQPQSVNFLEITDPRAVLENAFRDFAALTKGDIFTIKYNDDVFEIAVLDVKPETPKMGVSMTETDVSVEFAPPVGYVEPEKPRGSGTSTPRSIRGGLPAGGLLHNQGTMAQSINYDAITPSALSAAASNFRGEGQRLTKKGSTVPTPKSSTPVAGSSSNKNPESAPRRPTNGPMPLRLPPNKLFFGYEVKPVKSAAEKEEAAAGSKQPHFAGRGQSLRGTAKRSDDTDSEVPDTKKK